MRCEKCGKEFVGGEIHQHHIIPKGLGGKDINGRIYLCKKHHDELHKSIIKHVKKPLIKKQKNNIRAYVKKWIKNG